MRDSVPLRQVAHLAVCDSCQKTIRGARYKCMHPGCPDFDLCSDCEALPIPVHPLNHPMLKLKTSDAVIPTVYRVGQTHSIDEPASQKSASVHGESRSPALLHRSPLATPTKSPELSPIVVSGQATNVTEEDQKPFAEEFLSPLGSPANNVLGAAPTPLTIAPSHLLVDVADPPGSPQSIHPPLDIYYQLGNPVVNSIEDTVTESLAQSLAAEELLPLTRSISSISQAGEHCGTCPASPVPGINSIVDGYRAPSSIPSMVQEPKRIAQQFPADDQQEIVTANSPYGDCLDSALVGDTNVPDGQVFPPGAEFVKGWHMTNNGGLPWPTTT
ncbi:hypothetical protein J3R82DRAFT_544 [Butyriboletus roseoflavus]|nr:hypothetical protein J3R82DRAFT_544 [Butyriboletus roseoflavus]